MKKIRVATVFSGIGAIEFALKRLNIDHEIVFACDNGEREIEYSKDEEFEKVKELDSPQKKKQYVDDLYASKTRKTNFVKKSYLANYELSEDMFFQDICLLDGTDFKGKVDLFVGGSPCQSFSLVGYQRGLDDTRGTLFREFARLINEIEPKVFIYENVRNMLTHDGGRTWEVIKAVFEELNYEIDFKILNALDFGIPQKRNRLFVVGYKKETNSKPKISQIGKKCDYVLTDFLLSNCSYGNFTFDENGEIVINKTEFCEVEDRYYLSDAVKKYVLKDGTKNWHQKPETDLDIARTLLKTMGNCHRAGVDNYITEDKGLRMLTEREALRLMGFTDDFKRVVSIAQTYKQAGNSIVVDVMMNILKDIIDDYIFD